MFKSKLALHIIIFLILAGSCGIFYSNSLHNPFIWDDDGLIVKNSVIRSWQNLPKAFTADLYSGISLGTNFYRPLQTISYMWDYHLGRLDPYGYHLTNVFLQALVAFLVFLFSCSILKDRPVAFAAALFFALNPLHTEAVTYLSGRAEMLLALFLLSSLLLFIRNYRLLSWLAFIFALFSKELAVAFPLVISAYLFYYRREDLKKMSGFMKLVLPFLIIDFLYLFLRLSLLNFEYAHPPALTRYPLFIRVMVLPDIILTYFKLLILPLNLHMSWTLERSVGIFEVFLSWFFFGIIFAACGYVFKNKRNNKALSFMLFWFLCFLMPQAGILPINAFIAEHFLYLPSISFFMLAAYLLNKYLRKKLFFFSVALLAIFYGLLTFNRNLDWQDAEVFYKKIIKFSPNSFQAHNNLGLQFEYKHSYGDALAEYKKAIEIEPALIEPHSNLANLYFKMGKLKEARQEYAIVEKDCPKEKAGELQNNIGCVYEVEGLLDKAMERYKLALRLDPSLNFAHFNIARIYAVSGRRDLAGVEVLRSLPEISSSAAKDSKYLEAVNSYLKATNNFRLGVIFYNDLGIQFASGMLLDAAAGAFKRAIELDSLYDDAHFNLGLAYWKMGLKKEAIFEFKRALKINPKHLKAKGFLYKINCKND